MMEKLDELDGGRLAEMSALCMRNIMFMAVAYLLQLSRHCDSAEAMSCSLFAYSLLQEPEKLSH